MKKGLLIVLGLIVVSFLAACGSNKGDENISGETNNWAINKQNDDFLSDLRGKTSLNLEDLDKIDEYKFPTSYRYSVYNRDEWDSVAETWEYTYSKNDKFLLPMYETMVKREIINSVVDHDRINTTANITLQDGKVYPVLYINSLSTLEYMWATVNTPNSTIVYTFIY